MNTIIVFHKICSQRWFGDTIKIIGEKYKFVTIEDIQSYLDGKNSLNRSCHVCFDDGDLSFYRYAFPILKKTNISSTLFVSPKIVKEDLNYWFQEIEEMRLLMGDDKIKKKACEYLGINYDIAEKFNVNSLFKTMKIRHILSSIQELKKKHGIESIKKHNISTHELREVSESGNINIGAHTMNHPILKNENYQTAKYEISESINELSKLINKEIRYFAYPNGIPHLDYTTRDKKLLRENDIQLAFTTRENHFNRNSSRLDILGAVLKVFRRRKDYLF